jgi:N,N'-diacetylchitobiose phosphorylase
MRYGRFDDENREYVIERPDIPVSWTNYIGVRDLCAVLSHNAGGYSFYKSAEHHRITRFRQNGVPLDRPGHYVYVRDDESGEYWTISWQPVGRDLSRARYEVRHGLSYSRFTCETDGIQAEQLVFIPVEDDVELWDVRLRNVSDKPRQLSVFSYVEFSFHHIEIDNLNLQMSLYASGANYQDSIIEYDFFYEPWTFHYMTSSFTPDSFDCVRDRFLGDYHTESDPEAVINGKCTGSSELGGNSCGALHKRLILNPYQEKRLIFMLGVGPRPVGYAIKEKYSNFAEVDSAFANLKDYWQKKLDVFQSKTPNPGLNTMVNTWNLYQAKPA